jgi:hypothetical protein
MQHLVLRWCDVTFSTNPDATEMMERNNPVVVAEVAIKFAEYEGALLRNDLGALTTYFDEAPELVRFGIADVQHGPNELAAWRARQPVLPPGRTLSSTVIATFGEDFAVVATLFRYPGREAIGRQSQTWLRTAGRWRIVHAHVSEAAATTEDS